MSFSTVSTINPFLLKKILTVIPSIKYPIHTYAVLTKVGTNMTQTTNTGGFIQYTNTANDTYVSMNALVSNPAYFDSKTFTMYFAFKVNTYEGNKAILGFCGTMGANNGFLFHMTMTSATGIAWDWQINGGQYGYNSGNNSNAPSFPFVVGSISHMFITFNSSTLQYNFYIYNSLGSLVFSFLNRSYPNNLFASNYATGQRFSLFTLGNNCYGTNYSAKQTIAFFNFYERILTSTEMITMVNDST